MMKMMIVGRRRGGMTLAALHAYMADVHGAMVVRYIRAQPGEAPQRYVQNHVFDGTQRATVTLPDPFALNRDFVTQVWFDNPAQASASLETPFYREQLLPDEDRFVDQRSVVKLPVTEQVLKGDVAAAATHPFKVFAFLKRAAAVTAGDFGAASTALSNILLADRFSGIGRWVRNPVLQRPGQDAPVDLIDELWLADEAAARAVGASLLAAVETELSAWTAPGSTCVLLAREHVMHGENA